MQANGIGLLRPIVAATLGSVALLGCGSPNDTGRSLTALGEEREVRGTVTETTLTACAPIEGKPGTCEGTLVVSPQAPAEGGAVTVEVTRDVALTKDGQSVFLPQLEGSQVVVRYRATQEGPRLATSVTATS